VLLTVSRVDVAVEYEEEGGRNPSTWGERGYSAVWAVPAESRDRTMHVCDWSGSLVGIPPAR